MSLLTGKIAEAEVLKHGAGAGASAITGHDANPMEEFAHHVEHALHFKSLTIGGYTVHIDTLAYSWGIVILLALVAFIVGSRLKQVPKALSLQHLFEMLLNMFNGMAENLMGREGRKYVPFVATLFIFILCSNWTGLIPTFIPPSRDVNTTLGLALISFLAFNLFGIQKKGLFKWIAHFIDPIPKLWHDMEGAMKYIFVPILLPLFLVLNIVEEVARIVSLSMRLFGNIMGEHVVIAVFLGLVTFMSFGGTWVGIVFEPFPLFIWMLGLLAGFIQALVFSLLTLAYISGAVMEHH